MSIDFFGGDNTRTAVDFLVQIGILVGFGAGAIGFIYKVITGRLVRTIDDRIQPIKQSQDTLADKIDAIQKDLCTTSRNKEELDRERFRNVTDSQNFIKESIKMSLDNTTDVKKKLEDHLQYSASFVAKTEQKFIQIDQQMIDFRSFMRMVESR